MTLRDISDSMKRAARRSPALVGVYHRLRNLSHGARMRKADSRTESPVEAKNLVWIFGTGRSGSTWLRSIMGGLPGYRVWEEPMVGRLFGEFYVNAPDGNRNSPQFILGEPIRKGWIKSVRNFVLDGASYSHPGIRPGERIVVKEPNGSIGAPIIMEALPESALIVLVRDPRDAIASALDGAKEGNWLHEWRKSGAKGRGNLADERPEAFVKQRANLYRRNLSAALDAYEKHEGPKTILRYEDLRADTARVLKETYSKLGLPFREGELDHAVEKNSWEKIPDSEKGEGKFYRKASPGGWKEDLTERQIEIVETTTEPLISRFYA